MWLSVRGRELLYIWLGADVHGQEGGAGAEWSQAGRGSGPPARLLGADGADVAGGGHGGPDGPGGGGVADGATRGGGRGAGRVFRAGDGGGGGVRSGGRGGGGLLVHVWRQAASDGGGPGEEGLHVGLRRIQVAARTSRGRAGRPA